jgi:hypothetical protein
MPGFFPLQTETKQPDIEEAPAKGHPSTGASRALVSLGVEAAASTPLSYYNVTATLWGYSGQPLERPEKPY